MRWECCGHQARTRLRGLKSSSCLDLLSGHVVPWENDRLGSGFPIPLSLFFSSFPLGGRDDGVRGRDVVPPRYHDHGDILSTRLGRSWKKVKDRERTQASPSKMQPGARVRQTSSVPTGGEQAGGAQGRDPSCCSRSLCEDQRAVMGELRFYTTVSGLRLPAGDSQCHCFLPGVGLHLKSFPDMECLAEGSRTAP